MKIQKKIIITSFICSIIIVIVMYFILGQLSTAKKRTEIENDKEEKIEIYSKNITEDIEKDDEYYEESNISENINE